MAAGLLPRGPDLRRQPLAGRDVMAKRAERRGLRQAGFEQPVIDGGHAEQHGRLEALHRLGDARRGGPALQQDVAGADAKRGEHVADRIGKVKARGREQAVVAAAAQHLLVVFRAHADVAVMMLDRLRHARGAGGHHPERRIVWFARHRDERSGRRGFPGGQFAFAANEPGLRRDLGDGGGGKLGELAVDHQHRRTDDRENLLKLLGAGAARHRHRDSARGHRGEMRRDEVRRVEHQHADAVARLDAGLAQSRRELAHALLQRAVAQHFARAQQRRMLGSRDLEPVQQTIFDGIHYLGGDHFDDLDRRMRGRQHPRELQPGLVEQRLVFRHGALAAAGQQHDVQVEPAAGTRRVVGRHRLLQHQHARIRLHGAADVLQHLDAVIVVVVVQQMAEQIGVGALAARSRTHRRR